MPAERLLDGFWILRGDLEKCFRWTMWMAPALLPVAKSGHAYSDHERKLVLRFLELLPNGLHIFRSEYEFPARFGLTAKNAAAFTNTLDQLIKVFRIHLSSCCTAFARMRFCSAVRSFCSLFR